MTEKEAHRKTTNLIEQLESENKKLKDELKKKHKTIEVWKRKYTELKGDFNNLENHTKVLLKTANMVSDKFERVVKANEGFVKHCIPKEKVKELIRGTEAEVGSAGHTSLRLLKQKINKWEK